MREIAAKWPDLRDVGIFLKRGSKGVKKKKDTQEGGGEWQLRLNSLPGLVAGSHIGVEKLLFLFLFKA